MKMAGILFLTGHLRRGICHSYPSNLSSCTEVANEQEETQTPVHTIYPLVLRWQQEGRWDQIRASGSPFLTECLRRGTHLYEQPVSLHRCSRCSRRGVNSRAVRLSPCLEVLIIGNAGSSKCSRDPLC